MMTTLKRIIYTLPLAIVLALAVTQGPEATQADDAGYRMVKVQLNSAEAGEQLQAQLAGLDYDCKVSFQMVLDTVVVLYACP